MTSPPVPGFLASQRRLPVGRSGVSRLIQQPCRNVSTSKGSETLLGAVAHTNRRCSRAVIRAQQGVGALAVDELLYLPRRRANHSPTDQRSQASTNAARSLWRLVSNAASAATAAASRPTVVAGCRTSSEHTRQSSW